MKKVILVYVGLIVAFILLAVLGFGKNLPSLLPFGDNAEAEINGKTVELIVAKTDEDRIMGLSGKENLPKNQGMLFIFEEKGKYYFWMKEMKFAIDIIYINDDTVVHIVKNAAPPKDPGIIPERYAPAEPVNYVLELNAGKAEELNIEKGSKITFSGL